MQFLFQEEFFPEGVQLQDDFDARFEQFFAHYPVQKLARPYTLELLRGTIRHLDRIDTLIRDSASNWRIERIGLTDRNILRIAVYEMLFSADAPDQVVINEAVEIAKRYGTDDSPPFVNGILDAVRVAIRGCGDGQVRLDAAAAQAGTGNKAARDESEPFTKA